MILEVLLAAISAGVLVVLIAWGVSCTRCKDCESWRGGPGDEYAPCQDCNGAMEADNFCKNFGPKENANEH